jgi:hypothetical protein
VGSDSSRRCRHRGPTSHIPSALDLGSTSPDIFDAISTTDIQQEIFMKKGIVLFTGAILASAMFAGNGPGVTTNKMSCAKHTCCRAALEKAPITADPGAEERFRMKFGRNTPAKEARQRAAEEVFAKNMRNCAEHDCGRNAQEKAVTAIPADLSMCGPDCCQHD